MAESPAAGRKFNDEEVALIIKRAAELQQTEQIAQDPANAMSLAEVEAIAKEAGIDPSLVRRAANTLDRPSSTNRPSPWIGAPTHIVYERVIDGELSPDAYEPIVNEVRRTFGDNGVPSVLGRTLAWTSTSVGGRRHSRGRQIDVSVMSRGGVTTIRVEEELRNIVGAVFGGLVGGGGGGTSGITIAAGMELFHSAPMSAVLWLGVVGGFYTLARTIFGKLAEKREKQLRDVTDRIQSIAESSIASMQSQIGASSPGRSLGTGTLGTSEGS